MINGTGSNFKKMTYNNSNSGKSTGRNSYSGNHNLGPNHLQSNNNNPIPNSAMAALMNPSIAAAMINPYAMSGLQGQPPNRHQQQLGYISFPYPSASDPIRPPPYFQAQSGHAPRITIEGSYKSNVMSRV